MDNLLNVDNMEMIKTIAFLHENVKEITYNTLTYTEDDKTYIVDLNDRPIIISDSDKIKICGTFVLLSDDNSLSQFIKETKVRLYNLLTSFTNYVYTYIHGLADIVELGDQFIAIDTYGRGFIRDFKTINIYNKYLDIVFKTNNLLLNSKCIKDSPTKTIASHYTRDGSWRNIIFNKERACIELYDSYELKNPSGVMLYGTEWSKDVSWAATSKSIDNVRYQLYIQGACRGKSYLDINQPLDFHGSPYFMVYEADESNKSRICRGVEDYTGRELIGPYYDDIKYIGSHTFILTFYNLVRIHSLEKGMLFDNVPSRNVCIHETLPLTIVVDDFDCMCVDVYGRVFNVLNIARYFDCYATAEDPDTLKIDTGCKTVYVSRKLVPITNMHMINKLNTYAWFRI